MSDTCIKCHKPVGNTVFTVCDDCWPESSLASAPCSSCNELRCRIADIRDILNDLQKALRKRPGSLWHKTIVEKAIAMTNDKGLAVGRDRAESEA